MRKLRRLSLPLFMSSLMIFSFHVLLAALPVSAHTFTNKVNDNVLIPTTSGIIPGQESIYIQAIDELTITYSMPPLAGFPVFFTATVTTSISISQAEESVSAASVSYIWAFGDGTKASSIDPFISHIYALPMTYTMLVTAIDDTDFSFAIQEILVPVERPEQLFLPLIFKDFSADLADLTCSLSIEPSSPSAGQAVLITVEVKNEGEGAADGFWIDLYVNPTPPPEPGRANRISWRDACGEPDSCSRGVAWSVSNDLLSPGITRTFVTIPNIFNPVPHQGFDSAASNWESGILPAGSYQFYAYVDSINGLNESIDGAVDETNEDNNRCEKALSVPSALLFENNSYGPSNLPER